MVPFTGGISVCPCAGNVPRASALAGVVSASFQNQYVPIVATIKIGKTQRQRRRLRCREVKRRRPPDDRDICELNTIMGLLRCGIHCQLALKAFGFYLTTTIPDCRKIAGPRLTIRVGLFGRLILLADPIHIPADRLFIASLGGSVIVLFHAEIFLCDIAGVTVVGVLIALCIA